MFKYNAHGALHYLFYYGMVPNSNRMSECPLLILCYVNMNIPVGPLRFWAVANPTLGRAA